MRTRDKIIIVTILIVAFAGSMFVTRPQWIMAQSAFIAQWLRDNMAASSDGVSLKFETTSPATLTRDFATTDSVETVQTLTRTSTGTPAAGIGGSLDLGAETAAGNNEVGVRLAARTTDVTGASEDFALDFMHMAAGAAAATKMSLGSTGIVTLVNSATLDNATSATDLDITETTITLTASGGVTASADLSVTDDLTVGGWATYPSTTISAQSYTMSSTGKSSVYISEYSDTAASTIFLPDTPADGTWIVIKDGDLNANTNNIVVATEGSDTIDEAASYTMDADGEAVEVVYDTGGTDWNIIGGYGE